MSYQSTCRSCGAPVTWTVTAAGKRMPVDPDGTSHFATCPDAGTWRKRDNRVIPPAESDDE